MGLCPVCLAAPVVGGGVTLADIGLGAAIGGALIGIDRMFSNAFVDDPQAQAEHDEHGGNTASHRRRSKIRAMNFDGG